MRSWLGGIKASSLEGLQLQCSASLAVMIVTHELPREVSSSEGGDVSPPSRPHQAAPRLHLLDTARVVDQVWDHGTCSCESSQQRSLLFGFVDLVGFGGAVFISSTPVLEV